MGRIDVRGSFVRSFLVAAFSLCLVGGALSQDDLSFSSDPWQWNGSVQATTSHVSFTKWATGGEYRYNIGLNSSMNPRWSDSVWSFEGSWQGYFSVSKTKSQPYQKVSDQLDLNVKFGRVIADQFHVVVFADLRTQFWPEYVGWNNAYSYISNFLAPGYLTNGIGVDYRLDDPDFSIILTPLSTKQSMAFDNGVDGTLYGVPQGKKIFSEMGFYSNISLTLRMLENTTLSTRVILFQEYSRKTNTDVSVTGKVEYALLSFLNLYVLGQLVNDTDMNIPLFEDLDNDGSDDDFAGTSKDVQFKAEFGIAFSVSF